MMSVLNDKDNALNSALGPTTNRLESDDNYIKRLHMIAKERFIRGITTDEFMMELRGDPAEGPPLKK